MKPDGKSLGSGYVARVIFAVKSCGRMVRICENVLLSVPFEIADLSVIFLLDMSLCFSVFINLVASSELVFRKYFCQVLGISFIAKL